MVLIARDPCSARVIDLVMAPIAILGTSLVHISWFTSLAHTSALNQSSLWPRPATCPPLVGRKRVTARSELGGAPPRRNGGFLKVEKLRLKPFTTTPSFNRKWNWVFKLAPFAESRLWMHSGSPLTVCSKMDIHWPHEVLLWGV